MSHPSTDEAVAKKPFWGRCDACGHCWAIAYLPMPVEVAARLMQRACCPSCGGTRIMVAKQHDGVLEEPVL
jgi:Zn finger protein HypA/HybF involved in hydrogenase expression